MNSPDAIAILRQSEPALRERGVLHAALFGSVARGESHSGSDVDIIIEIDPDARITIFDYVELKEYIANLFDEPVDVVNRDGLKSYLAPAATADAVYAF
ncbi:nucleotidyltransferase domain-containing protein [Bradyrhizobium sp. 197]|jgi:predicted nucleotidyltransferase|uniref:nucleotidyltransferase family protein n=1 Tax=Bradyrhizobium sp. 197 TaxID=2782663 RepID=UPI001FFBA180|nr:nucleotidyltransferase domain-containing protein [Bradyrhizobium sp. 197]MCK1477434.1 nucleotidyltransferase domain-containing protein [Bradyrhizobium sp. 197]